MDDKLSGTGGAAQKEWVHPNNTTHELPLNMQFNHGHVVSITVYTALMVVSAAGNLTVLSLLTRRRRAARASRLDFLLMHLAIADLMVTFLMMPLEIAWAATVSWWAGDLMCRAMMFTRTFGLYLSSFVLVCISVDRYYAVLKPLCVTGEARARRLLSAAWVGAVLASIPQMCIFHVEEHPDVAGYYQCVSYGMFPTRTHEFLYFVVNMALMYLLPLFSTIYCYTAVLVEIVDRAKQPHDRVRRSGVGLLGRARARTLKMTITILIVFFTCWTPYYCYCIWYWIDMKSAEQLDQALQKALWLFSCTNSCANPIVYGLFNVRSDKNHPRGRSNSCIKGGSRLTYARTESIEISAAALARARAASFALNGHARRPSATPSALLHNNNHVNSPT